MIDETILGFQKKKGGTLDFHYFYIRKYSIFWFHFLSDKTLSSEKNETKIIWFGSGYSIESLQPCLETHSFTNFVKSARAIYDRYNIAVHKFFLCFVHTDQWAPGQQCMEVRNAKIIPDWNVTRMKRKLTMTMFLEMTIESNQFQPISMIL